MARVLTEAQWFSSDNASVVAMLEFLGDRISRRKLRLFLAACFESVIDETPGDFGAQVEALRQFSDGLLDHQQLSQYHYLIHKGTAQESSLWFCVMHTQLQWTSIAPALNNWDISGWRRGKEKKYQRKVLKEIVGNPFRPSVISPDALAWNHGAVIAIAEDIYERRDFAKMPILADALEDADCSDRNILHHCKEPYKCHVPGCWVLDLILGKQ